MAVKSREEFIESLKKQKPRVFILGEEVKNVAEHPLFQTGINGVMVTYLAATDPRYQEQATLFSPIIGEKINRWVHINQSAEDLLIRAKLTRELCSRHLCLLRCLTNDALNSVWAITFDLEKKYNT